MADFFFCIVRDVGTISYRVGNALDLDQLIELYRASTLGERRPVDDRERMRALLRSTAGCVSVNRSI